MGRGTITCPIVNTNGGVAQKQLQRKGMRKMEHGSRGGSWYLLGLGVGLGFQFPRSGNTGGGPLHDEGDQPGSGLKKQGIVKRNKMAMLGENDEFWTG